MNYQDFNGQIELTYNKHTRNVNIALKPTAKIKLLPGFAETLGFLFIEFVIMRILYVIVLINILKALDS